MTQEPSGEDYHEPASPPCGGMALAAPLGRAGSRRSGMQEFLNARDVQRIEIATKDMARKSYGPMPWNNWDQPPAEAFQASSTCLQPTSAIVLPSSSRKFSGPRKVM